MYNMFFGDDEEKKPKDTTDEIEVVSIETPAKESKETVRIKESINEIKDTVKDAAKEVKESLILLKKELEEEISEPVEVVEEKAKDEPIEVVEEKAKDEPVEEIERKL